MASPFESCFLSLKLLLLVGSINVLQEENKQLSTEMLIFIERWSGSLLSP